MIVARDEEATIGRCLDSVGFADERPTFEFRMGNAEMQRKLVEYLAKFHAGHEVFVYDEAKGLPDVGIPPGTRWEDVPEDWLCPDCGVGKEDFELI